MASRILPRALNQTRGYASQAAVRPPIQLDGIPGKYASAAYVSALKKGEKTLTKVESELKAFHDALKGDSAEATKLRTFLTNPTISTENREKVLSAIGGKSGTDEITRNLLETLSENGRLSLTEKVIGGFLELTGAHRGEVKIVITSAKPLDKSFASRLESTLKSSKYATTEGAKTTTFEFKVNPALQGGLTVDLGDRTIDLSVASRVNKFNALLHEDADPDVAPPPHSMDTWQAYKAEKEAWVAGQVGSSVLRINTVCATSLASYALWAVAKQYPLSQQHPIALDFFTLIVPLSLACTLLAEYTAELLGGLAVLIVGLYILRPSLDVPEITADAPEDVYAEDALADETDSPQLSAGDVDVSEHLGQALLNLDSLTPLSASPVLGTTELPEPEVGAASLDEPPVQETSVPARSPVLTVYRTYLMVLTVLCILAVDFPVFPRAFAKCESWGTSLMDLGVGSFVVSHGIVSLRMQRRLDLRRTARRTLPLLALGLVRVALVKRTEYPEHVSEYGVHWNFFLTLGVMIPALDVIQATADVPFALAGVGLCVVHEAFLSYTPLGAWALSEHRVPTSLLSLNKEGIASLPGYVALALCGLDLGTFVRGTSTNKRRALLVRTVAYWALYTATTQLGLVASRRLANLPYMLWNAAFNALFLFCFTALHDTFQRLQLGSADDVPLLFQQINDHSLWIFLLANITTGLVNLTIPTMRCGTLVAMLVLGAYTALMLGAAPIPPLMLAARSLIRAPLRMPQYITRMDLLRSYATDADSILDRITNQPGAGASVQDKRRSKLDQYNAKLAAKAQEQGVSSVEELAQKRREEEQARVKQEREARARAYADQVAAETAAKEGSVEERDAAMRERLQIRRRQEEEKKLNSDDPGMSGSPVKPLSSFLNIEKIQSESPDAVAKLWTAYHTMRDKLSAAVPAPTYQSMVETGRRYPQFVLPLPKTETTSEGKEETAFEMFFMQWALLPHPPGVPKTTPPPSAVLFTSLAEYKLRQEYAQPALVLTSYTDLIDSKDLALMRGDITEGQGTDTEPGKPVISQKEAQLLALCMQRFYNIDWTSESDAEGERLKVLLRTFHEQPESFKLEQLLDAAFKI